VMFLLPCSIQYLLIFIYFPQLHMTDTFSNFVICKLLLVTRRK